MAELGIFILYNKHASRLLHIKLDQIQFFLIIKFLSRRKSTAHGV